MEIMVNAQFRDLDRNDRFTFVKGSDETYTCKRVIQENYSDSGRKCIYVQDQNGYEGELIRHPKYPVWIYY